MSLRRPALAAVAVGLSAGLLLWWSLPDTHVEPVRVAPRSVPAPPPPVAVAPAPPTSRPPRPRPQGPGPVVPKVQPRPPVDPDKVYEVEVNGIAEALFDRYPQILGCYQAHVQAFGELRGRPTIRATAMPDGSFEAVIENDGEGLAELDACLAQAVNGLTFSPPEVPTTVLHPIPIPR